jgi:dTMP kinase
MEGRFITIEGGEGAGKSTAQVFLAQKLSEQGISVLQTREPGGTPLAEAIRRNLLSVEEEAPVEMAELLLVFAARAQHLTKVIEPALARGQWVLCDRFTDATYAYQGAGRGMSFGLIEKLEELVQGERRPDTVVLMDMPPKIGLARAKARGDLDRFEQEAQTFFERVREGYLDRAKQDHGRYAIVNAAEPLPQVQHALEAMASRWFDGP